MSAMAPELEPVSLAAPAPLRLLACSAAKRVSRWRQDPLVQKPLRHPARWDAEELWLPVVAPRLARAVPAALLEWPIAWPVW
jgi:hypothetical protein